MSKYRSLADIYSDNAFKRVPKLQRQKVIGEDVKIFFQTEIDDEPKIVGSLNDEQASKLRRKIINQSGGVASLLNDLLIKSHWKGSNEKEYISKVLGPVVEAVESNTDVDKKNLEQFIKDKRELTFFIDTLDQAAESETDFNIFEQIEPLLQDIFITDAHDTVVDIFLINPTLNNIGTGKGEILISMFTNAVKGDVGDLYFNGYGDVEVKGLKGRPGTSGNASRSIELLPKLLYNKKGSDVHTGEGIRDKFQQSVGVRNELYDYINNKLYNVMIKKGEKYISSYNEIKNIIDTELDKLDENENITKEFLENLKDNLHAEINSLVTFITQRTTLKNKVTNYINSLKDYLIASTNRMDYVPKVKKRKNKKSGEIEETGPTTTDVFQNFFLNEWGLSIDDIIEGFLLAANENKFNKKEFEEGLKEILLSDNNLRKLRRNNDDILLRAIIGAMQVSMYKEKEGFKVILFINDNTGNALPFKSKGDTVKERFIYTFNKFQQLMNKNLLKIGLNIDDRSNGVPISYIG